MGARKCNPLYSESARRSAGRRRGSDGSYRETLAVLVGEAIAVWFVLAQWYISNMEFAVKYSSRDLFELYGEPALLP